MDHSAVIVRDYFLARAANTTNTAESATRKLMHFFHHRPLFFLVVLFFSPVTLILPRPSPASTVNGSRFPAARRFVPGNKDRSRAAHSPTEKIKAMARYDGNHQRFNLGELFEFPSADIIKYRH